MFLVFFGPFWVQSGLSDVTMGVKILKFWNYDLTIGFLILKNVPMPIFRSKQSFCRVLLCRRLILGHFEWWQNGQISFLAVGGYFLDDLAKLKLSIILEYCCEHVLGSPFFWFWLWGVIDPPYLKQSCQVQIGGRMVLWYSLTKTTMQSANWWTIDPKIIQN